MKMNTGLKVSLTVGAILVSCVTNVVLLELMTSAAPGSANLITLAQFAFIALEGFIFATYLATKRRNIPLKHYLVLVIMFFMVSVSNNYALNFNISMPLHMIFKSGSLIANMILGIVILKRRYKLSKYLAVGLISVGIALCTISSAQNLKESPKDLNQETQNVLTNWLIGICLLTFSLFASARMGIYQETLYSRYGKYPREALFYCVIVAPFALPHALPLPAFLLLSSDIYSHAVTFSKSTLVNVAFLPLLSYQVQLPKLWLYLILNAITQYICARSVFTLTTECTSLTVTLVITLRKFISLLVSIYYFANPFTASHWVGTGLVFLGTFVFVEVPFLFRGKKVD